MLGLAFSKLSSGYPTILENLKSQGHIDSAMFSLYLNDMKNAEYQSSIILGGHNLTKYSDKEDFVYLNLSDQKGYWSVMLNAIEIGGSYLSLQSKTAMFDSGSSIFMGPRNEVDQVFDVISDAAL